MKNFWISISILWLWWFISSILGCSIQSYDLRAEYRRTPVLETSFPRLSWKIKLLSNLDPGTLQNQSQSAYRIVVSSSIFNLNNDKYDYWDSGQFFSSKTFGIKYNGLPINSSQIAYWKVFIWDNVGSFCDATEISYWESGLLNIFDWEGVWIRRNDPLPSNDCDCYNPNPVPILQTTFTIPQIQNVVSSRCYVAGLGYFVLFLNGKKVGDHELDVPWTDFSKEIMYSTFDVTSLLLSGNNTIQIMLGNGWYNPLPMKFWGFLNLREYLTVGPPKAILQCNIYNQDGSRQSVYTNTSWLAGEGPIIRNNIYIGIVYDANKETYSNFSLAIKTDSPGGVLIPSRVPPAKIQELIYPIGIYRNSDNVFVFDMGINFAGGVNINVQGPTKRNQAINLRYGELLNSDKSLNPMTSVAGQIKSKGCCGPCAPDVAYQE